MKFFNNKIIVILIAISFATVIFSLENSFKTRSRNQVNMRAQAKTDSSNSLKLMTSNKFLMDSYIKMHNLMKVHTENKYQSERGQLDFMAAFVDLGLSHRNSRSASNKRLNRESEEYFNFKNNINENEGYKDTINQYSFKSKEIENEMGKLRASDAAPNAGAAAGGNSTNGTSLEDWWMIYATEFLSNSRYPPLILPNDKPIHIKTGERGFRYNHAVNCTAGKPDTPYYFYFRLNEKSLFYASTKTDFNVLGLLDLDTVDDAVESHNHFNKTKIHCLTLNDRNNYNWKICNKDITIFKKWKCSIKDLLKIPDKACKDIKYISPNSTINGTQEVITVQPEVVIPLPSRDCNENWNYNSNGKDWECICKEGFEQSPIDLPPIASVIDSPIKPLFEYREVGQNAEYSTIDEIMNTGYPIDVRNEYGYISILHDNLGKLVTLDGAVYKAEEVTFHTPSNHRLQGKSFPLEINIIHYGVTKGDIAKQVVLSFLFDKKAGVYNKFIEDLDIFNIPNPITKKTRISNSIFINKILYNSNDEELVTFKPFSFYTYQGSLPFPPCTERTINYVISKPLQIGSTVIKLFEEALRRPDIMKKTGDTFQMIISNNLPVSNREIQPINGRPIFHYDYTKYCPVHPDKPKYKPHGHYEKMSREVEQVFYVSGTKPSGIPGAFVVPTEEVTGKKN